MEISLCFDEYQKYRKAKKVEEALCALNDMAEQLKTADKPDLCANHILEFYLYEYYFKTREYSAQKYPLHQMYYSLAKIYMERMHFDKALELLETAGSWNPVDMDIHWDVTECQKQLKQLDALYKSTVELYPYIYTRADIAHFYRNLGLYYVEKYEPDKAMLLYTYSNMFSHSKTADSEINYLETALNKNCPEYTLEEIYAELKKAGIPDGISATTLTILYRAGQLELEEGDKQAAIDCFELLYNVTGDEKIRELLDQLE